MLALITLLFNSTAFTSKSDGISNVISEALTTESVGNSLTVTGTLNSTPALPSIFSTFDILTVYGLSSEFLTTVKVSYRYLSVVIVSVVVSYLNIYVFNVNSFSETSISTITCSFLTSLPVSVEFTSKNEYPGASKSPSPTV